MPFPPEGFAVQVDDCPEVMDEGDALHEPKTGSVTVMVTGFELRDVVNAPAMPPVTVQVAVYEVVLVGDTDTLPPDAGDTEPTFEMVTKGPLVTL